MAWYNFTETNTYAKGNDKGVDVATPFHTPITALFGGTVVGTSCGGPGCEVDVQANVPGLGNGVIQYFLHLDQIAAGIVQGATVKAGQLIGLSGGQNSGGSHPASPQFSTGPHTEFGFFKQLNGRWNSGNTSYNPEPYLQAARNGTLTMSSSSSSPCDSLPEPLRSLCNAGQFGGQAAGQAASTVTDIPGAIGAGIVAGKIGLERAGLALLALAIVGLGIALLVAPEAVQAGKAAAGDAAKAAVLA